MQQPNSRRDEVRRRLIAVVTKFKAKGATSPEKAMTAEELGLSQKFKEAMQGRLGQSGLIVEVNGKYYLSEQRLREIQDRLVGSR